MTNKPDPLIKCPACGGYCGKMIERCCENPLYINNRDCCAIGVKEWVDCDLCDGAGEVCESKLAEANQAAESVALDVRFNDFKEGLI